MQKLKAVSVEDQNNSWSHNRGAELSRVANVVEKTLAAGFHWLRFPANLEDIFERETNAARARHMIIAGLIALLTYDLFLFSDYTMVPGIFRTALLMRLGIITPVALLVIAAQYRGLAPWLRESSGAFITACGGIGLVYLLVRTWDPGSSYYIYGLILVIMFGNIVLRLRFWYALAASLVIVAIYTAVDLMMLSSLPMVEVNNLLVLLSTVVLTLFANYSLEQDHRRSYLLNLRERIQHSALTERNDKLLELSHIDPLTGLANRRELAEYMELLLQKPANDRVAIVMFDVDHFKLYNDHYGHPMGDICLRQIAEVLTESSRKNADLVVRYGGEEFVAVLPGCTIPVAEHFAERILTAVRNLAIPHATSPIGKTVSISAGVAAGAVTTSADLQAILAGADAALYRAKSAGRDCVHQ